MAPMAIGACIHAVTYKNGIGFPLRIFSIVLTNWCTNFSFVAGSAHDPLHILADLGQVFV